MKLNNLHDFPDPPQGKTGWPWTSDLVTTRVDEGVLPKISIITPSYNQGGFIEETIRSVLLQDYPNLEYIIIDAGSTDQTVEIIRKYEKWISYWVSEKDSGQSDAINKGLRRATGEIFNWINSDDYLTPGALLTVGTTFLRERKTLCVRGNISFFGKAKQYYSSSLYSEDDAENIGFSPTRILQPATFFKTSLFNDSELGGFNEKARFVFDLEWMMRFLIKYGNKRIAQIPDVLCNFRLHENSKTVSENSGFEVETNSFFYSIAVHLGVIRIQKLFRTHFQIKEELALRIPDGSDSILLTKALNYFILFMGKVKYAARETSSAHLFFSQVDQRLLKPEQKNELFWLMFKNRVVPWKLIGR